MTTDTKTKCDWPHCEAHSERPFTDGWSFCGSHDMRFLAKWVMLCPKHSEMFEQVACDPQLLTDDGDE